MSEARTPDFGDQPWPEHYTYVPALRVGNMVWLSGTTGTDEAGRITAPGNIEEQTRQIFRKFERLLKSIGSSCDDIVATTDFSANVGRCAGGRSSAQGRPHSAVAVLRT